MRNISKLVAIFLLCLGFGVVAANLSQTSLSVSPDVFTREEALLRIGKKVVSRCAAQGIDPTQTTGRTMHVEKSEFYNGYVIAIDWDYSPLGKHEIIHTTKDSYLRCIQEVGEFTQ